MDDSSNPPQTKPRYLWPWFVALAFVVAVVLAVIVVRSEARRVQEQRQFQMPP